MADYRKDQKISVNELLSIIPDKELSRIASETKVDYYTKVLYGRSMFYLLLYGLLETERSSLRSLEDLYNDAKFKYLFNLSSVKTVTYSSLSERLSVMEVSFFEALFDLFYGRLSQLYSEKEILSSRIVRVDSSMVAEVSTKLLEGMCVGSKKDGKKQIKYTVAFDGLLPCDVEMFLSQAYLSEDMCIPEVVTKHALKNENNKIYVFDRGPKSRKNYSMLSENKIEFVTRLNVGSRNRLVRTIEEGTFRKIGDLELVRDMEVHLFDKKNKATTQTFRLLMGVDKDGKEFWFLTNIFDLEADLIFLSYKKRWDIEVFFRFLKQELNFSHFISTSENGIKIILYMTLILSMLVLIYKRINGWGYKTARRRFLKEMDDIIIKMIVLFCGGDPTLFFGSS
ncbi:MAG: IS4 family transposase [Tannerellaceae bacterium]|nr:IS4 family transposase [Tannerellaceae bacterium]